MKHLIFKSGNFERYVEVAPVSMPKGMYSISFYSVWRESKNPTEPRENFTMLLDAAGVSLLSMELPNLGVRDGKAW